MMKIRNSVFLGVFGMVSALLVAAGPASADPPVAQSSVVSAVPQTNTPDVQDGVVYAINQVGNKMFLGGSFTSIGEHGSVNVVSRNYIAAFDATTGKIDQGFKPAINDEVDAIIPGPGNSVYVAGKFTTVNGASTRVDLLDATTGQRVAGWTPPVLNGITQALTTVGGNLYIGGAFTTAASGGQQSPHSGLVEVNGSTGAVVKTMTVQLTGRHGTGTRTAPKGPKKLALSPDGTQMVVIGNFTDVADSPTATPLHNDQVVRLNLTSSTTASVKTDWSTAKYSAQCANGAFDYYIRDVQFSPDGSYFVIVATGGGTFDSNVDGSRSLCDTAARWETSDTGSDVSPTWKDYTGNDTFWSVAVTGTAVYAGGHQRWVNNTNGSDNAGEGAVPRPGIVALDPLNGLPLSWNPGRNPRGAGAYVMFATPSGIWVGSDTDYIGSYKYKHMKVAFFPLAGGYSIPPSTVGTVPGNVFEAGPLQSNQHPEVLYRVDAGGPTIGANDNGPDWVGDQSDPSPYRNGGSNAAGWSPLPTRGSNLPASTPSAIFDSERWSPSDSPPMQWDFPVPSGRTVTVRLFFANRCTCTSGSGQRKFNVSLEGNQVLSNYDIVAEVGDQTGTMKEFTGVVSDGHINIDFSHSVENPLVNGIEIIQTNPVVPPPPPGNGDSLLSRHLDASGNVGPTTTVDTTSLDWTQVRGAFMVNGELYYGLTDGTFNERTFNGSTLGPEVPIDPYNDPLWSTVNNGSGGTYRGAVPDLYGQLGGVSSMFFDHGRVYYTMTGSSRMFYRYFTPDSGVIGADQFTVDDGGLDWSNTAGAFVTGSTLYYATKSDGVLHKIGWSTDHATGSSSVVDSTNNWASHSLFLLSDVARVNKPPVASFTATCGSGTLSCSFDASGSHDPDGSISSYDWTFGDGTTSHNTDSSVTHAYASAGDKTVTLTVTDNDGATNASSVVVHPTTQNAQISFVGETDQATTGKTVQLGVPSGTVAGDTLLLFQTWNSPNVTTTTPAGWTLQQSYVNGTAVRTNVYVKVATAGDVGGTAVATFASSVKFTATLADYTGTAGSPVGVIASLNDSGTANHTTPVVNVPTDGSYVVSYWADKAANAPTTWTTPAGVTRRAVDFAGGTGTVSTQLADSGSPVASGSYGGKVASVDTTSTKGLTITLSLQPAP